MGVLDGVSALFTNEHCNSQANTPRHRLCEHVLQNGAFACCCYGMRLAEIEAPIADELRITQWTECVRRFSWICFIAS